MKLSQDDVALFYDIFFKLIDYTNDRYQVVPGLEKASGAEDVNPLAITPVRDKLWENDDVINCIVSDNPFCFAKRELLLVAGWKRRVTGNFLIYKHLKKYTVFMGNGALYGVVGLASPIEDVFPSFDLPRYSRVTLLPFEGKIIYDSLLYTYNVTFGSGSRRGFNEEYRELKNKDGIIATL